MQRTLHLFFLLTHGRDLESVVGAPVVNVMAQTGNKESQSLQIAEERKAIAVEVEDIAEVGHGKGMEPVVVRLVTVALLHHQQKPEHGNENLSSGRWPLLNCMPTVKSQ